MKKEKKIDEKITALNKILFVESNPIPVKYALFLMGFIKLEFVFLLLFWIQNFMRV